MLSKKTQQKSGIDLAIDQILFEMQGYTCDEAEYDAMTDQLKKLYKIKGTTTQDRISRNTLAVIAGNIFVVVLIVAYEQKAVVTTKATNFLLNATSVIPR
jgi:hypothetical protein